MDGRRIDSRIDSRPSCLRYRLTSANVAFRLDSSMDQCGFLISGLLIFSHLCAITDAFRKTPPRPHLVALERPLNCVTQPLLSNLLNRYLIPITLSLKRNHYMSYRLYSDHLR
jgi:hypothetical protein